MTNDGRIRYEVKFIDGKGITLSDLHGFQVMPDGWRARVTVSVVPGSLPGSIQVTPFPGRPDVLPLHLGNGATSIASRTRHARATSTSRFS